MGKEISKEAYDKLYPGMAGMFQNFTGARQLCARCGEPTGRCKEDALYLWDEDDSKFDEGPLCDACFDKG
jgi:MinD superfamily P-loop ATPase